MANLENFVASVEVPSGLKPMGNNTFPIAQAHDILAGYDEDGNEIRLDDKIDGIQSTHWYSGKGTLSNGQLIGVTLTAKLGDMYLNTDTGDVYRCTKGGSWVDARWENICNIKGTNGKSAYEYAKANGYTGTEEEFAKLLGNVNSVVSSQADIRQQISQLSSRVSILEGDDADDEPIPEITYETTANGYYDNNGRFISQSGYTAYRTNLVPVVEGDQFVYTGWAPYSSNVSVIWYSSENTKLSHEKYDARKGAVMLTAPAGANYARFYSMDDGNSAFIMEVEYVPKTRPLDIVISTKDGGYFDNNNNSHYRWSAVNGQSKYTNAIPVQPGDEFDYTGFAKWSIAGVVWSDSSGNKLSNEQYADGDNPKTVRVTAPAEAAFVRFFSFSYGTATLVVTKITKEEEEEAMLNSNLLWGKKYVACGDSFTEGAYSSKTEETWSDKYQTYKTYPFWIASRNNMTLVNEAKSGSDFTNISGAQNPFSVSRYKEVPTDADYITLMFGLNETGIGADSALIGTSADTTNATLWGAYNIVFEYFLTNMPYAKIGVIIADAWMTSTYANAVKEICKYWGIPYLDLKGDDVPMGIGGRYTATSSKARELRNNAFQVSADDSHPNIKAHEYRSTIIENFLRSL